MFASFWVCYSNFGVIRKFCFCGIVVSEGARNQKVEGSNPACHKILKNEVKTIVLVLELY